MIESFGPATGAPSVEATLAAALETGEVNPLVAVAAGANDSPSAIAEDTDTVNTAAQEVLDGDTVPNRDAVLTAASALDSYITTSCA